MKETKNKVTAIAMATTIAVTSMAPVPATTVYAQELDKPQIEAKVNEENKEQDNAKVEASVIENKKDEEVKEETNTVENNESAEDKENTNDKVNEEEKDNVKEEEIKDNVENKEETEVKDNVENKEETEVKNDVEKNEATENAEIKDSNEKVEDKTLEKVENEELSKTEEVEDSEEEKVEGIEIIKENFPDEGFRKFVSLNFDKDKDGILSDEEANSVKEIYVNDKKSIRSLEGIEHFKNLEVLDCSKSYVGSLDLSSNVALTYLDCSETLIESLDVSNNTALRYLDCAYAGIELKFGREGIGSLDVTNNTVLEYLDCRGADIKILDVSKNTILTYLDCSDTDITKLDISNNLALTTLHCSHTAITSLDVSKNTALTDLECEAITITSLDISKNLSLTNLNCSKTAITALDVSNNIYLKNLKCDNIVITNLDVSNNTRLEELSCNKTKITNLDVSNNTRLEKLSCYETKITNLDVSRNISLKYLSLWGVSITSLNIGNNPELWVGKEDSIERKLNVTGDSFDIAKELDIIDVTKIENIQGATISGNIVSGYSNETPIAFEYNCGTSSIGKEILKITLSITASEEVSEGIAIDATNFPASGFRNYVSVRFDSDQDGFLSEEEIKNARGIDLYETRIHSLEGIEHLKNLEEIRLTTLPIKNLDLSKNTALKKIWISDTDITSLDVNNNFSLEELTCIDTEITNLDVSNNKALKKLRCESTGITSLDVSNNTALESLDCSNSGIVSLNIGNNENLKVIKDDVIRKELTITGNPFDIKKELGILDVTKIENMQGAKLNGDMVSGYLSKNPIIFEYNCGTSKNGKEVLSIAVYLKKADVSIEINSNLDKIYDGTTVKLTKNDCAITGSNGNVTFTYFKKNANGAWESVSEAKEIGEYKVKAKLEGTNLETEQEFKIEQEFTEVPIDATRFPDEEFRNYISSEFDNDKDGILSEKELNNVEVINGPLNIKNLQGIEYFKNLKVLYCGSGIISLDLSKNIALEKLYCSSSGIRNLDLSKNIALEELNCSYSGITKLDVSNNPNLERLDCYGTKITSLDVSKNAALKYLSCSNTKITKLDVSRNTVLEELRCYDTEITSLDLSKNIKKISCYNTKITKLDISKNTALEDLSCSNTKITKLDISKNTDLKYLSCSNTGIKKLDVSNNPNLRSLYCSNTEIRKLDVSNNPNLERLDCFDTKIESLNIGNNSNLKTYNINKLEKELAIKGDSFDITKELDIIDVTKIENIQGATLNGNIISGYSFKTPITFEYNCGTSASGKEVLEVTLNIKNGSSTIEISTDLDRVYTGNPVELTKNDCIIVASDAEVTFTYYKKNIFGAWKSVSKATDAGEYKVRAKLEGTDIKTEKKFKIEKATPEYKVPNDLIANVGQTLKDVKLPEGFEWVDSKQSVGNVGANKFIAKYTPSDTKNYNVVENIEITVTVSKEVISGIAINEANFEDKAFRKYISDNFDKDKDGILSDEEADSVKEINVNNNKSIKSLKGIENFKNLEILNCSSTGVTSLDLSKNTTLKKLDCSNTVAKRSFIIRKASKGITNLDLSNNIELEELNCSNTEITSLDVSKNTALKTLNVSNNIALTSLDVSKNTVLKELDCSNTGLTRLDVSNNKELTSLNCSNTEIESLNIGDNPNLPSINKDNTMEKELTIAGNSFDITKELDIIDVTKIENIQGATLNGNIVSGYSYKTPITFEYNCGTSASGKEILKVTLNIKNGNVLIENAWKVAPSIKGWTYGEKANAPVGSAEHGKVTFSYSNSKDGKFESTVPSNAGTWYMKATVSATDEYTGLNEIVEFKIEKATPKYEIPTNLKSTVGQTLQDVKLPEGFVWVDATQSVGNVGANKFIANYTPKDTANYNVVENIEITVTVSKEVAPEIVEPSNLSAAQNDLLSTIKLPEGWEWVNPTEVVTVKNKGYKARLKVDDQKYDYTNVQGYNADGHYVERTLKVSVSKGENAWKVAPSIKGWTYGEKANAPVGSAEHGDVTFTYSNSKDGKFESTVPSNAGTWYMKATVSATDEYTALNEIVEFKIEKATPKYEIPTNLKSTVGQTLQDVKLPEGFAWVDATQSVGNVGANKFIANYTPKDTANYNVVENIEITVTVSKEVAPEVVEPSNLSAIQNDLLSTINLPEGWAWVNPNEQVTTGNEGYKARLNVDDNKYDYTNVQGYNADEHYVERTLKVFVSENRNEWTVVPSINGWTYGEKANTPLGTAKYGDVTFTYSNSPNGEFENTVPSNAGTWYMKATVLLTENHTGLNEIIEFKIEKATPKYEIPTNLKATVGQTLKDIKLPEGFAWVDDTQSVGNAGANKFIAKYIPNDTQNYDVVENIEITVTVSNSNNSNSNNNNVGNNNNSSNGNNNSGSTGKDEVVVKPTLPQTGERNTLGLWGLVLTITGGAIAFITGKSSKTIRKEK